MRRTIIASVVLALGASCSTVHGVATKQTTGSTVPHRNDKSIVNQVVLRLDDLPGQWTAGPTEADDQSQDADIARCLDIPNSDPHKTAYAGSPQFQQGVVQISSQASIYDSASVVQSDLRGAQGSSFIRCETRAFNAVVSGGSNLKMHLAPLPAAARGLDGFRIQGSARVTSGGKTATVSFDEVGLAKGRLEASVNLLSVQLAEPSGLMDRATAALAPRLADAGG